jgi:UDP-glucose 4-epimerase
MDPQLNISVLDEVKMSDRILVTGAAGFIGRHLIERIIETEPSTEIVATDIKSDPPDRYQEYVGTDVTYISGDITDPPFRGELLSDPFDRIYHFAAIVGVDQYVKNPLKITEVNVVATKEILEAIQDWDVRFVFTSTSEIYGKNPDVPWKETSDRILGTPTIDRWSYSTGKSACEHMIHGLAASESPFTATVIRPFNLYGPGQRPKFAIPAFVENVVNGDVPTVYDQGTQTRCFTYIDDFINGLLHASRVPEGENQVFNLGSTRETEIQELADMVLELAGYPDRDPEYIDTDDLYGDSYEDLERRVPDALKAKNLLDWEAETTLEDGIKEVIDWGREHYTDG